VRLLFSLSLCDTEKSKKKAKYDTPSSTAASNTAATESSGAAAAASSTTVAKNGTAAAASTTVARSSTAAAGASTATAASASRSEVDYPLKVMNCLKLAVLNAQMKPALRAEFEFDASLRFDVSRADGCVRSWLLDTTNNRFSIDSCPSDTKANFVFSASEEFLNSWTSKPANGFRNTVHEMMKRVEAEQTNRAAAHGDAADPKDSGPFGEKAFKGNRPRMEDMSCCVPRLGGAEKRAFYGVYDGHGGPHVAEFAAKRMHEVVRSSHLTVPPRHLLLSAFKIVEEEWKAISDAKGHSTVGTCAIAALILSKTVHVANVGDCRAVLWSDGKASPLSVDHNAGSNEDEKTRITALGGRVVYYGCWRVEGSLAVTRAIGDEHLKQYVISVPEIVTHPIQEKDEFLILASDGLWDVFTNQEACEYVASFLKYGASYTKLSHLLVMAAFERGSADNITAVIVNLKAYA
jgi:protein phosphatase 1L